MTIESPPALNLLSPRAVLLGPGNADALENVIPTQLPDGAVCWVIDQQRFSYLDKTSVAPVAPPIIIATALGALEPGRWVQVATGGGGPPSGAASGQLSGTYPAPLVVGLTESGTAQLAIGAIANGQVLQRSGANLIGVAATFPPNGAAGGDLAGTYPNPSVAALTTTSGPTQLVIGAVATGQLLQRVGATLVGVDAAGTPLQSAALTDANQTLTISQRYVQAAGSITVDRIKTITPPVTAGAGFLLEIGTQGAGLDVSIVNGGLLGGTLATVVAGTRMAVWLVSDGANMVLASLMPLGAEPT